MKNISFGCISLFKNLFFLNSILHTALDRFQLVKWLIFTITTLITSHEYSTQLQNVKANVVLRYNFFFSFIVLQRTVPAVRTIFERLLSSYVNVTDLLQGKYVLLIFVTIIGQNTLRVIFLRFVRSWLSFGSLIETISHSTRKFCLSKRSWHTVSQRRIWGYVRLFTMHYCIYVYCIIYDNDIIH